MTQKLENACGQREINVNGRLALNGGIITGLLTIAVGDFANAKNDRFQVEMSIRGKYSKLGKPFWQFPARFINVTHQQETKRQRSEKWMKENWAQK